MPKHTYTLTSPAPVRNCTYGSLQFAEIEINVSKGVCGAHIDNDDDDVKAEKLFRSIRFTLESENKIQKNNNRPKVNSH